MTNLTALLPPDENRSVQTILACSSLCAGHGLSLTPADAKSIAQTHIRALAENRLVEIGCGSVEKIIGEFAKSPYADRRNFASLVETMTEAFCWLKREADKEVSDTTMIAAMRAMFDNVSQGSEELFLGRDLEKLLPCIRSGSPADRILQYIGTETVVEHMEAPSVGDRGGFLREYFQNAPESEAEVWEEEYDDRADRI